MIKFNRVNYFKFVLSLCFIVFFIFVITNADLFENNQEQLAINSSFIQSDDGTSSYEINLDNLNINVDLDNNNNGIIEYSVQSGDTLLKIAGVFGTTVSSIQKENNLKGTDIEPGKVLNVSNHVDGILYTIQDKTNVMVFANKYNLGTEGLQDLMTLNYIQDQSELFSPGQEIFINITKEKSYELGLLERPKPEIIPKSTITYRPTINKPGTKPTKTIKRTVTIVSENQYDTPDNVKPKKNTIISKWTYTKKIKNGFAVGYCTWYAAIISPEMFPFVDEEKTIQNRPFGGDAKNWCANAKSAGFRVGSTPSVGALIVYGPLTSNAGHVGKVIKYDPGVGDMVIREMNYLGKFVVDDRKEDVNNSKIKCYIYGK